MVVTKSIMDQCISYQSTITRLLPYLDWGDRQGLAIDLCLDGVEEEADERQEKCPHGRAVSQDCDQSDSGQSVTCFWCLNFGTFFIYIT